MCKKAMMGRISIFLGALVLVGALAGLTLASGGASMTPDQALQKLMAGNKQYVQGRTNGAKQSGPKTRASLAKSQKPYAVVLGCSDSRVPTEIIFNKGMGEIFVIRDAGNVLAPTVVGSIEYAVEHLGSPLIMVLGHERCGAVTATVDAHGGSSGSPNVDAILKEIEPSIAVAKKECKPCAGCAKGSDISKGTLIECVIDANAKSVAANLPAQSKIIRELLEEKKLKIVAAKYDLDTGVVTLFK